MGILSRLPALGLAVVMGLVHSPGGDGVGHITVAVDTSTPARQTAALCLDKNNNA